MLRRRGKARPYLLMPQSSSIQQAQSHYPAILAASTLKPGPMVEERLMRLI